MPICIVCGKEFEYTEEYKAKVGGSIARKSICSVECWGKAMREKLDLNELWQQTYG